MTPDSLITSHLNRFANFYENSRYCDISIIVGGENHYVQRTFLAHSAILMAQSEYFAVALSDAWVKRDPNKMIVFKKPNIKPHVFEILLRYMYSGKIDLNGHDDDALTLLDLLTAADELILEDLVEYIQIYLTEHHSDSLNENAALTYQLVYEHHNFNILHKSCQEIICRNLASVFHSDFVRLHEATLVSLLKKDDLNLKEIEIWEKVLKWGIVQASESSEIDLTVPLEKWTHTEFNQLKTILINCLPLIRFFHISSVDFQTKVLPYSEILPRTLYKSLLNHYTVPGSEDYQVNLYRIRKPNVSTILSSHQLNKIAEWLTEQENREIRPFDLKLLFRGSTDGFTNTDFHRLCDNKGPTIVVISVKNKNKTIGGYNPYEWNSLDGNYYGLVKSFLFEFDSNDTLGSNGILSKYQHGRSIACLPNHGPIFGDGCDLALVGPKFSTDDQSPKFSINDNFCKKSSYTHGLLGTDLERVWFRLLDYEVFQVR